ncbi:hypothetical protein SNE40_007345 [Patella caerulea]|uniref:Uncharacterized protein n=1 Tax=Patella caerulea TaxID=87958 RepID=A0AAN8JXH6_PATCE
MLNIRIGVLVFYYLYACVSFVEGCREQCLFHYDNSFEESEKRCGQVSTGRVSIQNNKASFSGFGFIALPVFKGNTLQPYFALAFRFRYTGAVTSKKQPIVLISNGCEMNSPTIELSIAGSTLTLKLVLTVDEEKNDVVLISIPDVDVAKETHVKIGQDNTRIRILVGEHPMHIIEKSMHEHVVSSECPLQIGAGYGLLPFVGEIDEFVFYPCINEDFFDKETFP